MGHYVVTDRNRSVKEWPPTSPRSHNVLSRCYLDERNRPDDAFFAIVVRREIEAWLLVGSEKPGNWTYTEVRDEPHVKERYFEPYAEQRGVDEGQFGGRKPLGEEAARNYRTLRQHCEELQVLERKIQSWEDAR
jgi:hypothetical protein